MYLRPRIHGNEGTDHLIIKNFTRIATKIEPIISAFSVKILDDVLHKCDPQFKHLKIKSYTMCYANGVH